MAIIDPEGLFGGERLAALSDKARLYWPWLYSACNGYGRMELNPRAIIRRCFPSFTEPMTEQQLIIILSEYAENFLLFVYEHDGQQWIQFDTPAKLLPRHKTKKDESSPNPSPESRAAFESGYLSWKKAKSFCLHSGSQSRQLFRADVRGIGIGIGEGIGIAPKPLSEKPKRLNPEMIAKAVQVETGILRDKAFIVLVDVVRREQGLGIPDDSIRDAMVSAWAKFQAAKSKLEYFWGAEKFFGEPNWKDPQNWPWKEGQQPVPARKYATVAS